MAPEIPEPLLPARVGRIVGWSALIIFMVIGIFNFPFPPSPDLDPSWRMALSYFYEKGMQFGPEVNFTYGPLGFLMGKTFSGFQFWPLIAGQLLLALIAAVVIAYQASRLTGRTRLIFLIFFLLLGITYEDALHMLIIALLGFELLRRGNLPWKHTTALIAVVLSVYSQIKFTNLLLAAFVVLLACGYSAWMKRRREALGLGLAFVFAYLGGWLLLGQHLRNLPAYLAGSWHISDGFLWCMGIPAPFDPLWKGIVLLVLLIGYSVLHVRLNPDKPRAVANTLMLGAFIYLNWKHGYVRADGHIFGFIFCAMLPLSAYPALLDDPPCFRRTHYWVFLGAMLLGLTALENTLPGTMRGVFGQAQAKVWENIESTVNWSQTRQNYREKLAAARANIDLYLTREIIGHSTVDVVGYEIGVALLNSFNYQPRPVIQSYSTFSPPLDKLNADLYASARAPAYVLSKIQTIDNRLPTMDDAHVLLLLAQRYEYLRTEKGYGLWRLKPGAFDPASIVPHPLRTGDLPVNQPLALEDISDRPLWAKIDLQPSLLGRIRSFFYKPPQVTLHIEIGLDDQKEKPGSKPSEQADAGDKKPVIEKASAQRTFAPQVTVYNDPEKIQQRDYLMPLPQGRTGFILNPLIEDVEDYMNYANTQLIKRVRSITLKIPQDQLKYFSAHAAVELGALPSPTSGRRYFTDEIERLFHMFATYPVSYTALTPVSEATIDGITVVVVHAPSQMVFDVPAGARFVSGKFGMLPGTYTAGGNTDGALFLIYWSNGTDRVELFRQYLDPVNAIADRGLHDFNLPLSERTGGQLFLEIQSGPRNNTSWDWTVWTDINISTQAP